jgi:DNA-directed RNA polymerase subunit RPC12/RpoP
MARLDTFPGIDECIFCYGRVRPATRREVEAHLRTVSADLGAALERQGGTWYACPRCGPKSVVKWQSIAWE